MSILFLHKFLESAFLYLFLTEIPLMFIVKFLNIKLRNFQNALLLVKLGVCLQKMTVSQISP